MNDHSHSHSGSGTHNHEHPPVRNRRVLWWVLVLTGSYLVAEIIGGIASGSLALLADAGHMALDVAAVALGLFAAWIARRPPSARKSYGYYRAEILAALLNGITLVVVSLWIFYEAWERFAAPPEVRGGLMAVIAAGGLLVNVVGMYLMHSHRESGLNMQGVWLHLLTDALGSVAALLGGFFVWKYQWYLADPIISVVIGLLILLGAWKLLIDCIDVLMVSVPKGIQPEVIKHDVESIPKVLEVHDLHLWSINTGVNAMSAHVKVKDTSDYNSILADIFKMLKERHDLSHVTLQLEPPEFHHSDEHLCTPGRSFHTH